MFHKTHVDRGARVVIITLCVARHGQKSDGHRQVSGSKTSVGLRLPGVVLMWVPVVLASPRA